MNRNEPRLTQMDPDGPRWIRMDPDELRWIQIDPYGPRWSQMFHSNHEFRLGLKMKIKVNKQKDEL